MATEILPSIHERVSSILREPGATLYGLVDSAQDPEILPLLHEGDCPFDSLYQGESAIVMASVAPYLVQLTPESTLLDQLVSKGWGNNWGIFLRSVFPLSAMRRHFRHFTMVELSDGQAAYFRFYDPRVFRVFIPTCNVSECQSIFAGVEAFYTGGSDGSSMNRFRLGSAGRLIIETLFDQSDLQAG